MGRSSKDYQSIADAQNKTIESMLNVVRMSEKDVTDLLHTYNSKITEIESQMQHLTAACAVSGQPCASRGGAHLVTVRSLTLLLAFCFSFLFFDRSFLSTVRRSTGRGWRCARCWAKGAIAL